MTVQRISDQSVLEDLRPIKASLLIILPADISSSFLWRTSTTQSRLLLKKKKLCYVSREKSYLLESSCQRLIFFEKTTLETFSQSGQYLITVENTRQRVSMPPRPEFEVHHGTLDKLAKNEYSILINLCSTYIGTGEFHPMIFVKSRTTASSQSSISDSFRSSWGRGQIVDILYFSLKLMQSNRADFFFRKQ